MLGPHRLLPELQAVAGIHRSLAHQTADLLTQGAGAHGIIIWILLREGELRHRLCLLWHDLFVLGQFRLAADSAIRGIINVRAA
jgi:hypothetical protein